MTYSPPWRRDVTAALSVVEPNAVLGVTNGVPTVSSRDIAAQFDKRHDNIIRDISELEISSELRGSWFLRDTYMDGANRPQPMVHMTKDGFTFLCMGWTGEKAAAFKVRYILAFNKMEAELRAREKTALAPSADFGRLEGMIEKLIGLVSSMVAMSVPINVPPAPVAIAAPPVARPASPDNYMTASSWLAARGEFFVGNRLGVRAYQAAQRAGIPVGKKDTHMFRGQMQTLNTYPVSLLAKVWATRR